MGEAEHREADTQAPGQYAAHRHVIDDPEGRKALLLQVKGTVDGLRSAFRFHAILALAAVALLFLMRPQGWIAEHRMLLVACALAIDLVALAGLRTVAVAPARYVLPLAGLDIVTTVVILVESWRYGAFHLAWLLLLVMPIMLLIYLRDARAIQPVLAEHAAWRKAQE